MATDFDTLKQHASALYDELHGTDLSRKANNSLRKLIYQLEMMDNKTNTVPPTTRELANWLVRVCDVEHGILVKHYPDTPNETDGQNIDQHITIQQQQLHAGKTLHAEVERGIKHLAGMLGATGVQDIEIADRINWFANALLEHLREDRDMGEKLHQLALATMQSLQSVQQMMGRIGVESPELQHAANMLERPIPDDPIKARDYLKQISNNLQHVQSKMIEHGKAASQDIDQRVQAFEGVSKQFSASKNEERSDVLTGLPNRRALIDYLELQAQYVTATLAIVDVEQLQQIITSAGQIGANRCLCELADFLVDHLRAEDMVFHIGKGKFVLVFPNIDANEAIKSTVVLHAEVNKIQLSLSGRNFHIRTSFGLAERKVDERQQAWIKRADAALYIARGRGGNCVQLSA